MGMRGESCLPNVSGFSCAGRAQRDPRLLQAVVGQPPGTFDGKPQASRLEETRKLALTQVLINPQSAERSCLPNHCATRSKMERRPQSRIAPKQAERRLSGRSTQQDIDQLGGC